MEEKKRGSVWGAVLGAALLILGAAFGLPRFGTAGLVWTIAGAVLLGYNLWALLRRSGKSAPRTFSMPDPVEQERELAAAKAELTELEKRFKSGEVGYEEYVRLRLEIVSRL
ncbi:MAG: hypothetical protein IKO83_00850 [Oscillospiraceae bacterium]|nr:hypothetical protein [Oscillospiraceae bacterium]